MPRSCLVRGCGEKLKNWSSLKFHSLPMKFPDRLRRWLLAVNLDPATSLQRLNKKIICSRHFLPEDYFEFTSSTQATSIMLKDSAIPSVNIPRTDIQHPAMEKLIDSEDGKAAVTEANLRDEYYWKLVADFVGPQSGEGLDLDKDLCKNRLMIQVGLIKEDHNFSWIAVIDWLKRIFPAHRSADFRRLIERASTTMLSLEAEARLTFLESHINLNFVGPICDSIGVERQHLLKMKDFSERAKSIEVTNGLILELSNFAAREKISPINMVTWLRNFNPEFCKDGKTRKAYKILKSKIKKIMSYVNSETRSQRKNVAMENVLQRPFDLVKSRSVALEMMLKRRMKKRLHGEQMKVKEENDPHDISPVPSKRMRQQASPGDENEDGLGASDSGGEPENQDDALPSLLDVMLLSVQKLATVFHGQTEDCKNISLELQKNQYTLACKNCPAMEEFEKAINSVSEQVSLAPPLLFLYQNAHFLVDLHNAVEHHVVEFEKEITQSTGQQLGRDRNPLFKNMVNMPESATSRYVHMARDVLCPQSASMLNYKKHWAAFCKEKNNPSRLCRAPAAQFSSYFEAAAALTHHHKEVAIFFLDMLSLNNDQCPNVLLESVAADASDSVIQSIVCVLAIVYCKIVGPYWQLLKSDGEYSLFSQYLLCLYQKFLDWSKDPATLLEPEGVANVFLQFPMQEKLFSGVYDFCGEWHTNRDLIRVLLKRLLKVIAGVTEEHLKMFLPGGTYSKVPSTDINRKLISFKFSTLIVEYPSNMLQDFKPSSHKDLSTSGSSQDDDLSSSNSDYSSGGPAKNQDDTTLKPGKSYLRRPVKKAYPENMDLDYITDTVRKNGGPCKTQTDVDKLLLRISDQTKLERREAIRCEIVYQKIVLNNSDPNLDYAFCNSTQMMLKLKLALPRIKPGYSLVWAPVKSKMAKPANQNAQAATASSLKEEQPTQL
ncbi:uncharacterized protein LOC133550858 [Nerophis ophidion]|uniref:uncharacterized protein LOC133550858 n=1 Tax=Nerophis ophidion TaxID=159077 RepID=UPI002AE0A59D|nr:uncharacterized protein LOC133550858 [Nerophis ophidion]XP_061752929.1 uncharacterized protein LOC133550858 [Nerophis ophidion]